MVGCILLCLLHVPGTCSDSVFHSNEGLQVIPMDRIPHSTTKIYLDSNQIRTVAVKQFAPLRSCVYIDLSDNQISSIRDGAFFGLRHLRTLLLAKNRLTALTFEMFAGK